MSWPEPFHCWSGFGNHWSIVLEGGSPELKGGKGVQVDKRDSDHFDDRQCPIHLSRPLRMTMARRGKSV